MAGVLHAVGGDDEQRLFRPVLFAGVLVDVADMVDGAAHGVKQSRAAAHEILLPGQLLHLVQRNAIVDHLADVVEKHRRDKRLARLLLLLLHHRVEPADGVRLQAFHRTAAVQDEHDFG